VFITTPVEALFPLRTHYFSKLSAFIQAKYALVRFFELIRPDYFEKIRRIKIFYETDLLLRHQIY
jgi:hypothetical protein